MSYVMVPVPEELAGDVGGLLFRLQYRAYYGDWDEESIRERITHVDDDERALLEALIRAFRVGQKPEVGELAASLGMSERELIGLVRDLNDDLVGGPKLADLFVIRTTSDTDPSGSDRPVRVLEASEQVIAAISGLE